MNCKKDGCDNPHIPRGKYCTIHRTVKKPCKTPGCPSGARSATDYCKKHGGGKRCAEPGCPSSAQGTTDYCIAHGGGKRCAKPDCPSSAKGATDYCVAHGGGKRCAEPECPSGAESPTDYCKKHGGGKRCIEPGCPSSAQGSTDYCKKHGGGKRCAEPGCPFSAQGTTDYCKAHGGGTRCPNCIGWPDSRCGDAKYDWYCATCFKRIFPDDPRSTHIYEHTKESRVRNAISKESLSNPKFKGFIHDHPLYTGDCECSHRRRVDHRKLIGNTILAVETDEFAHSGYDKQDEDVRYDDLYMIHSGKWIFIRFNPDVTKTQKVDLEDRIVVLLEEIQNKYNE